jgi:hypothetical protein
VDKVLTESDVGIIPVSGIVGAKVSKTKRVEVPFVGWIAERAEIGIVRSDDHDRPAGSNQAVELLHCFHDVRDMLDHMDRAQFVERLVAKGVRKQVEIGNYVGARAGVAVESDGTGILVDSTADVEDSLGHVYTSVAAKTKRLSDVRGIEARTAQHQELGQVLRSQQTD